VRLGDLYSRLAQQGVAIPGGTCPGVGIAGLTLGGGIGFLSRHHGLTCDRLLAVDLVDADGRRMRASDDENADLFWALRGGGGGNFGIATAFTFRTSPAPNVLLCAISWPWENAPEVLDAWQRWAPFVDPRLTCGFAIGPPSDGVISAIALFTGSAGELTSLLTPLPRAGSPGPPRIWPATWLDATRYLGGSGGAHARFKNASGFADALLPPAAITTLVDHLRAAPAGQDLVGFFPLQGAVAAVDPTATAFVHRRALFDLQYQAYWWDEADAVAGVAWARGIRDAMLPYTAGAYVNYIDADLPDWARAYYGSNLARLTRVKAAYDPDNLFAAPQAIPAALGSR
jgi:FAD/FMN-containing dehydrogenase